MSNLEIKSYEDLKNNESIQLDNSLKILIKEIDEIKDTRNKDDDEIKWIFTETTEWQIVKESLNQELLKSLEKLDTEILKIIIDETDKLLNDDSLELDDNIKNSLNVLKICLLKILWEKYTEKIPQNDREISQNHLEWIWEFRDGEFEFNQAIKQWNDDWWNYIEFWWTTYREFIKDMTWPGYWYDIDEWIFYIWNFKNWSYENQWALIGIWGKYIWNFLNGNKHWQWKEIYTNWNEFEWNFSYNKLIQWTFTIKSSEEEEKIYNVVRYNDKVMKITSWPDINKFIKWYGNWEYEITDEPQNPQIIEWIWHIEWEEIIFDNITEKLDEFGEKFIEIGWHKYYKYKDGMNWSWYLTGIDFFYIWEFTDGLCNWQWKTFYINWDRYEWEFTDGLYNWQWKTFCINWDKYEWKYANGYYNWQWIYTYKNWDIIDCTKEWDYFEWWEPKYWTKIFKDNSVYTWEFQDRKITWFWTMRYKNELELTWNFQKGELKEWTAILPWDKNIYYIVRDDIWLKITTPQEYNGKYIVETTWKISNWEIELDANNVENILGVKLTDKQIQNLTKIKELWININIKNIEEISELDEEDIDILKIDSEWFGEWYDYSPEELQAHHNYKRWRIIEYIQSYVEKIINNENRKIYKREIREKVRSDLVTLPSEERLQILLWINKIIKKFNTVHDYIDFEHWSHRKEYPNAKALLCGIQGITNPDVINKITNDITVIQHWSWFTFFVNDEDSYHIIYGRWYADWFWSGWFNNSWSEIPDLQWTLSVVNWNNPNNDTEDYKYWTIWHEWQHNRNVYFMGENDKEVPIARAKDEITAYLRDWRWIFEEDKRFETIFNYLTTPEDEGWLYQYGLEWDEWEIHKQQVTELLRYANDIINLTKQPETWLRRDFVISMLSDTPGSDRWNLHSKIMEATKHENPINLQEFWRAWTEEKQTEINEINLANSIEDIKHILNDPKYSHISRIPNNKWWIEISAIIDEVVTWKLDISYIPPEIKQQVQKFIIQ